MKRRTVTAFLLHNLLGAPMMALYTMLPFILHRQEAASSLQVTVLIMLKPMVSLISFHWSYWSEGRTHDLKRQLILSEIVCRFPFLILPFVTNAWVSIACAGCYVTFSRGANPAWMELLKRELPERLRNKVYAWGSTLFYLGMLGAAAFLGVFLDWHPELWSWLGAGVAAAGVLLLPALLALSGELSLRTDTAGSSLLQPWIQSHQLLQKHKAFAHFQWGFFIAGGGLILMQPALPTYFTENLDLSYKGIALALSICKGVGFALTSQLWARQLQQTPFLRLSSTVAFMGIIYTGYLLLAQHALPFVYAAYLLYGVMQAGSELAWNLSGPIFAQNDDSRAYTRVSILLQGIRGAMIPPLGMYVVDHHNASTGLYCGGLLCALGAVYLLVAQRALAPSLRTQS